MDFIMRKKLSLRRILLVICLVNGLGYIAGFLVSGQPSIYSKSFQLTDGSLTRRVVIPVISHISESLFLSVLKGQDKEKWKSNSVSQSYKDNRTHFRKDDLGKNQ